MSSRNVIFSVIRDEPLHAAGWLLVLLPPALLISGGVADGVAILVSLLFLRHCAVAGDWAWLKTRWVRIALLLWGYLILRSFFAEDWEAALGRSLSWGRYPLLAAALSYGVLGDGTIRRYLWRSLALTVGFLCLDALFQFAAGHDILGHPTVISENALRLTGPFSGPKIGIVLTWLAFPVLMPLLLRAKGGLRPSREVAAGAVAAILVLLVVFLSGERMAFLLMLLGMGISIMLLPVPKRWVAGFVTLKILLLGIVLWMHPGVMERQMLSTGQTLAHFSQTPYGQIFGSAARIIAQNPLFGVGPRNFRTACLDAAYGPMDHLETRCNLHPHNTYLEWLTESGLLGTALFIALLAAMLGPVLRGYKSARMDPVALGLLVALTLRLWPVASSTGFFTSWSAIPFWFAIGWLIALRAPMPEEGKAVQENGV